MNILWNTTVEVIFHIEVQSLISQVSKIRRTEEFHKSFVLEWSGVQKQSLINPANWSSVRNTDKWF